jgi:tRNA-splicing ligase RtcB
MEQVINTPRLPIKSWVTDLEDKALDQALDLADLPFTESHIALMPDAHMGYGMPIGGVLATRGVVVPNAVGVDIGCGMAYAEMPTIFLDKDQEIDDIIALIRRKIPVGQNSRSKPMTGATVPWGDMMHLPVVREHFDHSKLQLGTLGGGNHFIEIQRNSETELGASIMIHSGSRNLGKQVADHYHRAAKGLNEEFYSPVPRDLAFLPMGHHLGNAYMNEMNYCIDYAKKNRELMMGIVYDVFHEVLGFCPTIGMNLDCCHNFARLENHFGKNLLVHRKGATSAQMGEFAVIPGSQGAHSYVVEGLGNPDSFKSCSHGAGRRMSRKAAKLVLDLDTERMKAKNAGSRVTTLTTEAQLDEAPGAYKDIDEVMANQLDLVKVIRQLSPLATVKG